MQFRNIIPAIAILAPLISAQSSNYMESEGLSSLSAEGMAAQASIYSSLVDSIQGVLAV
jgi:hypothetical protein